MALVPPAGRLKEHAAELKARGSIAKKRLFIRNKQHDSALHENVRNVAPFGRSERAVQKPE